MAWHSFLTGNTDDSDFKGALDKYKVDNIDQNAYGMDQGAQGNINNWQGHQQDVAKSYGEVLAGRAPSVAQTQLEMGQDAAMRQLQSAAASHRGMNAGLANRNLMNAQSNLLGQQNGQQALVRANEMNMARSGLGQLSTAARGQSFNEGDAARNAQIAFQRDRYQQQQHIQDMNVNREEQNNQGVQKLTTSLISAGGTVLGGALGGGGGGSLLNSAVQGGTQGVAQSFANQAGQQVSSSDAYAAQQGGIDPYTGQPRDPQYGGPARPYGSYRQ